MAAPTAQERPQITVFSLGGTIASTADQGGGAMIRLRGEDLIRSVPAIGDYATVEVRNVQQVPSGDLTTDDLLAVIADIRRLQAGKDVGVVVTQGTDTLEETAYLADLLLSGDSPVVFTGAMRNPSLPGADGPGNLLAAVQVAASPAARGLGVLVVMNDQIHAARFVRKRETTSTATFGSPLVGPLGVVIEGRVNIYVRPPGRLLVRLPDRIERARVELLITVFDDDGELLEAANASHVDGLVLASFGGGHVPARVVPTLAAIAKDIPVVLSSRTFGGELLHQTYGYPGSETDLLANGLISARALDPLRARLLLMLALMAGADRQVIDLAFERALTGVGETIIGA
jgi:L-asparaginase